MHWSFLLTLLAVSTLVASGQPLDRRQYEYQPEGLTAGGVTSTLNNTHHSRTLRARSSVMIKPPTCTGGKVSERQMTQGRCHQLGTEVRLPMKFTPDEGATCAYARNDNGAQTMGHCHIPTWARMSTALERQLRNLEQQLANTRV
ncbi:hypothetical protein Hypma_002354 [Hypsizygus marmoreus]|uniref:Uncharacterized protein n=1 Tax=Hypsizygus marmoreus TaxID=39966 RepID=A0A369J455_HYPMA|nr:hypothetical protein Hypma_002354 [Hypsizygus marmoreus]